MRAHASSEWTTSGVSYFTVDGDERCRCGLVVVVLERIGDDGSRSFIGDLMKVDLQGRSV